MGCDIHLFTEKRVGGKWLHADKLTPSPYKEDGGRLRVDYKDSFYHNRNYALFAILADVRNGIGFAGCDTGDRFNPIAEPRGVPDDASQFIKDEAEAWNGDGHSHSWFTVQELLDYDWTQTTKLRGWVNAVTYFEWREWGRDNGEMPKEYSGGVSGQRVKKISVAEMETAINQREKEAQNYRAQHALIADQLRDTYCQIEVEQPYYKTARDFLGNAIPRLLRLGRPGDVRIVFWFDN